ncbi:MAG: hypothetical protein IJG68_07115 [Bacilli bacterium]|nr:hypothetical protein [Bacilli bacterium]
MRRKNKQITTYFILFSLLLIGVIYAILQANLQINGTAKIKANTWNIYFNNIQVNPNSVSINAGYQAATIIDDTTITFAVDLAYPGDFYEFTVDVVNSGTIDGMISDISSKINDVEITTLPAYLNYKVTYSSGAEIKAKQVLRASTQETIKIRVEILRDIEVEDLPSSEQDLIISFELNYAQADDTAIEVSHIMPVLTEGLIPVTIANDGTVTAISKNDSNWFNYKTKQWANAVLVTETNRSTYRSIADGVGNNTTIPASDILAYYVWIPRYSYKIWTLDTNSNHQGQEQTIDIKFVSSETKETGSIVGEYYTHPAFTFGEEELLGFWAGKFETTGTSFTPTILSNSSPLLGQNTSGEFASSLIPAGGTQSGSTITFTGNNTYGLTSVADSHMMKNSEWGAVAYLSHSIYGINGEIRSNNYYNNGAYKTGCGASTINSSTSTSCEIVFGNASSYPQSTTGNISGIFDMSGGVLEDVMGNYDGLIGSSGFTSLPDNKYINIYPATVFTGSIGTNITFCTISTCGGHALNETSNWYSNNTYFIDSSSQWVTRGDDISWAGPQHSGLFGYTCGDGINMGASIAWRSVLVARE